MLSLVWERLSRSTLTAFRFWLLFRKLISFYIFSTFFMTSRLFFGWHLCRYTFDVELSLGAAISVSFSCFRFRFEFWKSNCWRFLYTFVRFFFYLCLEISVQYDNFRFRVEFCKIDALQYVVYLGFSVEVAVSLTFNCFQILTRVLENLLSTFYFIFFSIFISRKYCG